MTEQIRLKRKTWLDASRVIAILADKIVALEARVDALEADTPKKKLKKKEDSVE